MENNYLKYLINEDIYVINEQAQKAEYPAEAEPIPKAEEPAIEEKKPSIKVSGNEASGIYIINFDSDHEFIAPDQKALLENILKAIKLDLQQVALINLAGTDIKASEFIKTRAIKTCLIFGPNAESTIEKYTITPYNECQILLADSLALIDADKEKKKALWTNLQQLFLK